MKKQSCIVLKNYQPNWQKITLLDEQWGKIEARIKEPQERITRLTTGAHITYFAQEGTNLCILSAVDIVNIPYSLAREDIHFLHTLIEICYYFLPLKCNASSIFALIFHIFTTEKEFSKSAKTLILCRFFGLLGLHPEELPFSYETFINICRHPLDHEIFKNSLDEETLIVVQSWLLRCIDLHPDKKLFKTFFQSPKCRT